MLKNQKNKYAMYNGVIAHLEKNSSKYTDNEEFINHRNAFKSLTEFIGSKEDERSKATKGKTKDKEANREKVTIFALGVAGAICAYAKKSRMTTLAESTKLTKTKLDSLRDNVLLIELKSIRDVAMLYSDAMSKYGFPPEKLEEFVNSILQYSNALGAKANGGAVRTGAFKSLKTLFKEADSMLDSIDRLMENYRDTHKEFYDGYKASRVIKNLGIRHNPEEEPVNPEVPVQVVGEGS